MNLKERLKRKENDNIKVKPKDKNELLHASKVS